MGVVRTCKNPLIAQRCQYCFLTLASFHGYIILSIAVTPSHCNQNPRPALHANLWLKFVFFPPHQGDQKIFWTLLSCNPSHWPMGNNICAMEKPCIAKGQMIPNVSLDNGFPPKKVPLSEIIGGKKVVMLGLPGALTPTWSTKTVPGYINRQAELKEKGVSDGIVYCVNESAVLEAWGKDLKIDNHLEVLSRRRLMAPLCHCVSLWRQFLSAHWGLSLGTQASGRDASVTWCCLVFFCAFGLTKRHLGGSWCHVFLSCSHFRPMPDMFFLYFQAIRILVVTSIYKTQRWFSMDDSMIS